MIIIDDDTDTVRLEYEPSAEQFQRYLRREVELARWNLGFSDVDTAADTAHSLATLEASREGREHVLVLQAQAMKVAA